MFALKLLGGAVLEGRAGAVAGRAAHKRRLALLSLLALARRPVGRERLIGYLWAEHPADSARHLLSESLYVLRRELGDDVFTTSGDELALNPAVVRSDVADFEAALEAGEPEIAAGVYRGPFLDGFFVADAPEFERWAEGERERLARAHARALETLAEREEGAGRAVAALEWWRRLAAHEPYSSRVALRLTRALEAAGERAGALRFAAAHAALLREELGVDPDGEFLACVRELRDRAAAGPAPAVAPVSAPSAGAGRQVDASLPAADPGDASAAAAGGAGGAGAPREPAYYGALAGLIGGFALAAVLARPPAEPAVPRYAPTRIAVFVFDDDSPGGGQAYLANGLTRLVIGRLSQVEALEVIPYNGVKPYRDGKMPPFDTVVAQLRVGSTVEGSVQRSEERVRVTVRLVDANQKRELESTVIDRPWGELFALQDALADSVAVFLRRRLGPQVRLREREAGTRSADALELVLKAEQEMEEAQRVKATLGKEAVLERLRAADALLERAAAEDRGWPEPLVLRGWAKVREGNASDRPTALDRYAAAAGLADRALRLRPGLPAALELRGTARWQTVRLDVLPEAENDARGRAAERDLRAALDADPSRATAWSTLSQYLRLHAGDFAKAYHAAARALREDAYLDDAEDIHDRLYRSAYTLMWYDSASAWCERGRRAFPTNPRFLECRLTLMSADSAVPADVGVAWRLVDLAAQVDPPGPAATLATPYNTLLFRPMLAARVLARAGMADSARAVVDRMKREAGDDDELTHPLLYDEAIVRVMLGERDVPLALLEEYVRGKDRIRGYLSREPQLRPLRGDPRFQALVRPPPPAPPPAPRTRPGRARFAPPAFRRPEPHG